jgi:hypothetical protein
MAHQRNDRKHQPANDGAGDEVAREHIHALFDELTHHQQDGGDADGLGDVELDGDHGVSP